MLRLGKLNLQEVQKLKVKEMKPYVSSLRSILPEIRYRGDIFIIGKKSKSFTLFVMFFFVLSGLTGLEPATSAVTGRRSNQLNYRPSNMNSMMPYLIRFCNIFLFISRNKSISINTQIVPLAVTDLVNQGIIKLPYFNTIAFQHFFNVFLK